MKNNRNPLKEVFNKIGKPFFTTKPTGEGTGLRLSMCYDSINALSRELKVETKEGVGTSFLIHILSNN
jgi:signal transduction histidine kinase